MTQDLHVATARVGEDRLERGLRGAAIEVAGRRRPGLGPLGPEEFVDLAHAPGRGRIGRSVLGVPHGAALTLDTADVTADRRRPDWIEIAHDTSVARGADAPPMVSRTRSPSNLRLLDLTLFYILRKACI